MSEELTYYGQKEMEIAKLKLPGDFRSRLESPRIVERARSIGRIGMLNKPYVRKSDKRVICGNDRIAAVAVTGATHVLVEMVECSDAIADEIEAAENCQRRHDADEQRRSTARLIEIYQGVLNAQAAGAGQEGKPVSKDEAIRRLATERGVRPETIRKTLQRVNVKHKKETFQKPVKEQLKAQATAEPVVELIGMDVEEEFIRQTKCIYDWVMEADHRMRNAVGAMTLLEKSGLPYPAARLQRIQEDLRAVGSALRGFVPASLCPWCKGLGGIQEQCTACVNTGWISADQADGVPKDLWNVGRNAYVVYRGRYVRVADVMRTMVDPKAEGAAATLDKEPEDLIA